MDIDKAGGGGESEQVCFQVYEKERKEGVQDGLEGRGGGGGGGGRRGERVTVEQDCFLKEKGREEGQLIRLQSQQAADRFCANFTLQPRKNKNKTKTKTKSFGPLPIACRCCDGSGDTGSCSGCGCGCGCSCTCGGCITRAAGLVPGCLPPAGLAGQAPSVECQDRKGRNSSELKRAQG